MQHICVAYAASSNQVASASRTASVRLGKWQIGLSAEAQILRAIGPIFRQE